MPGWHSMNTWTCFTLQFLLIFALNFFVLASKLLNFNKHLNWRMNSRVRLCLCMHETPARFHYFIRSLLWIKINTNGIECQLSSIKIKSSWLNGLLFFLFFQVYWEFNCDSIVFSDCNWFTGVLTRCEKCNNLLLI